MGKSSKDKRDAYYRLAKEQGWRARSAFKLLHLDEDFSLFGPDVTRVVDLCAAPGSWSQVLSRVLIKGECLGRRAWKRKMELEKHWVVEGNTEEKEKLAAEDEDRGFDFDLGEPKPRKNVRIVAVDLQPIASLEGVTSLVADITDERTIPRILEALDPKIQDKKHTKYMGGKSEDKGEEMSQSLGDLTLEAEQNPESETSKENASSAKVEASDKSDGNQKEERRPVDLVICDGAPDVTGLHDMDTYIQSQLLYSALSLTIRILKPGGKFVAKIFRGKDVDFIYAQMRCFFEKVTCAKPRSSRASSLEAFVVCEGFTMPEGFSVDDMLPLGRGGNLDLPVVKEQDSTEGFVDGQRRTVRDDGITILDFEENVSPLKNGRWIAPFVACGDLSAWDADATYHLPENHVSLDPVAPPTNPPYKAAIEERRRQGGLYGKTKK